MAKENGSDSTADGYRQRVLEKCAYFVDVGIWPLHNILDPEPWLSNFAEAEMEYALNLLDSFVYFSEAAVDALLLAGVQALSRTMKGDRPTLSTAQATWRSFMDNVIVTYVTGEVPNVTDSGFAFARKARQILGIPEERIMAPDAALDHGLIEGGPILFVDDFVGSGSQCISTWHRTYETTRGPSSFAQIYGTLGSAFYCPLVCTDRGLSAIKARCPGLTVEPTHTIGPEHSALTSTSVLWPDRLKPSAVDFVERASQRAGIPDTGGAAVDDWRGFRSLGLALAFQHSVPDATLPLFYWERNGWRPLLRRQ